MNFFEALAGAKAEQRAALAESIIAGQQPEPGSPAREQLEQLLPPETLADLDERVLALVTGEGGPEPEPTFLEDVAAAKEAERRTLVEALLGRGPRTPTPAETGSLDGGARMTTPGPPQTHEEWLMDVLRTGRANAGSRL